MEGADAPTPIHRLKAYPRYDVRILPCRMCTHVFVYIIHRMLFPWCVIIMPTHNAHPYFPSISRARQGASYAAKCVSEDRACRKLIAVKWGHTGGARV